MYIDIAPDLLKVIQFNDKIGIAKNLVECTGYFETDPKGGIP